MAAPATSVLGLMVTRGSRWVIGSWLRRHGAMFERLAVLDGSPPGSVDALFCAAQCSVHANVIYGLEESAVCNVD